MPRSSSSVLGVVDVRRRRPWARPIRRPTLLSDLAGDGGCPPIVTGHSLPAAGLAEESRTFFPLRWRRVRSWYGDPCELIFSTD